MCVCVCVCVCVPWLLVSSASADTRTTHGPYSRQKKKDVQTLLLRSRGHAAVMVDLAISAVGGFDTLAFWMGGE